MGQDTGIQWTNNTFNPWWGCTKISPGCEHCYAATFASRTGLAWGKDATRRFFGEKHWNEPRKWNARAAKTRTPERVFCASMADVFEPRPELQPEREKLWKLIAETPMLDWQLLTKRPENVPDLVPTAWMKKWPDHVWIGTSVENQDQADRRIPALLKIPARTRFLSAEPLLGPIDFNAIPCTSCTGAPKHMGALYGTIDWVIIGGESGDKCRPMEPHWARGIMRQCQEAGVAVFMKQMGGARDKKGALEDLPEDLRVREFPQPRLLDAPFPDPCTQPTLL